MSSTPVVASMTTTTSFSPEELVQARVELWNLTFGYLKSMAVECAVTLGIPNAIHSLGGAASLSDLAPLLSGVVPAHRKPYLPRLLRFLAATGILAARDDDDNNNNNGDAYYYSLTPMSRLLVDDTNINGCTSLAPWVLSQTTTYHVAAAQHLSAWFAGGDGEAAVATPFEMAYGAGVGPWDAARSDPRFNEVFNAGMEADSRLALEAAIAGGCGEALFGGVGSLVDVAGGTGGAAKAIARAFPHVKCSVLDLPHVVSGITQTLSASSAAADDDAAAALVEYIPGDMMEYIPPADAVFLKYIMHDWSDEVCVKILTQCKKAICSQKPDGGGKVIIIDVIVGSPSKSEAAMFEAQALLDVLMMAVTSGKERDESEWRKIFMDAGFSHYEAKPLLGFMSIIQLYP
ncbi:unnamed protein product [Urochloa humidicola]